MLAWQSAGEPIEPTFEAALFACLQDLANTMFLSQVRLCEPQTSHLQARPASVSSHALVQNDP